MIATPLANSICAIRSSSSVELQASSTHSMHNTPLQSTRQYLPSHPEIPQACPQRYHQPSPKSQQ